MSKFLKGALLASASSVAAVAFESGTPGWKMDGDKLAVDASGNPIYVDGAGKELSVQGTTISNLNQEAKTHREAKEKVEEALGKFRDDKGVLLDPEAARKAIDLASKIDAKTLIDAGKVDEVRDQLKAEFTTQLGEKDTLNTKLQSQIDGLLIDRVFDASEFVRDELAIPVDFFRSTMRDHFKVEGGKVVVYDKTGNRLVSKTAAGEYATGDEALRLLVETRADKDSIIKPQQTPGGGTGGGSGGGRGSSKTIRRSEFDALSPGEKAAIATKGEVTVVD